MMRKSVLVLPLVFALGLASLAILAPIREDHRTFWAFVGSSIALVVWNALLTLSMRSRRPVVEVILKKQHYVQAFGQCLVMLYWGWYWRPVYNSMYLLLAQLLFAYAFDMLLGWSRRDTYTLGFGPIPVVFSINLFLWFKPDWFYLQFLMLAMGFAAKDVIRWNKEGRSAHIFNPSSFPLAVVSLVLLAAGATDLTLGREIATTQFYPPHIYLVLFLIGLLGQYFFGVTLMTMSAVLSTYVFSLVYYAANGIYFFYDSYIPISVFLGMHLLFTDPATAPRTELGRIVFGVFYGLSTVVLYQLLGSWGMPTFYDKLLQVPLMNLSIKGIDRIARSRLLRFLDPAQFGASLAPRHRHLVFMSIWGLVFVGMSAAQGVGDDHPGQWMPFWRQACLDGRPYACPYLADLQLTYCRRGSGWACNAAGLSHVALSQSGEDLRRQNLAGAAEPFQMGCDQGFAAACQNLKTLATGSGKFSGAPPTVGDLPIILRGSKGEIHEREPSVLYALACRQGWPNMCGLTDSTGSR